MHMKHSKQHCVRSGTFLASTGNMLRNILAQAQLADRAQHTGRENENAVRNRADMLQTG